MNLSKYIAELLVKNNCVIVPNFGGFIANYNPAIIDELRHKIYPPSKRVLFNSNLLNNDGLLANYVSTQISKNYAESLELIEEVSTKWKSKLSKGQRVSIGEVGFLYEVDNKIQFEQDREFNLFLGAYGLSSVNFLPLVEQEKAQTIASVDEASVGLVFDMNAVTGFIKPVEINKTTSVVDFPYARKKSNRWKYLAAACFIPVLFYSYWIPMETHYLDSGNIQMADFNPLQKKVDKVYKTRIEKNDFTVVEFESNLLAKAKVLSSSVKYYNYQFSDELYIPVSLNENKVKRDKTNVVSDSKVAVNTKSKTIENNFHLIAGCFSDESNAVLFVIDLKEKGYDSVIIDRNKGLYRVAVQSFSSKGKAVEFKSKLASKSISSWLLTK